MNQVWNSALLILLVGQIGVVVYSVNLNRYDKLKKEEFLKLDREVTEYFHDNYEALDDRNVTYDQYLFTSIRALRHTIVLNQFDYKYTNEEILQKSKGAKVNQARCEQELKTLVEIAKASAKGQTISLSAINFLESNGRAESGTLNGNFVWWGSQSSCVRARIPAKLSKRHAPNNEHATDLIGRYCVAHLKAKSWKKSDIYFEDRISIKVGLCVPQSCHTSAYLELEQIQQDVDYLTRYNLVPPYNGDRYETTYLYCLPDEDSPFRQWDLGTKLFICFAAFWLTLLIYTNIKYHQRLQTMRKLRESIDIRMIINQKRESGEEIETDEEEELLASAMSKSSLSQVIRPDIGLQSASASESAAASDKIQPQSTIEQANQQQSHAKGSSSLSPQSLMPPDQSGGNRSRVSSANPSPLPSDIEENDGEFNAIRPIVVDNKNKRTRKRASIQHNHHSADDRAQTGDIEHEGVDFIKVFSIKSNLEYLFKTRTNERRAKQNAQRSKRGSQQVGLLSSVSNQKRLSQQLSAISRRTSSSNEALIKDLQQEEEQGETGLKSKVAIVSGGAHAGLSERSIGGIKKKRVDIDIFDGIKVFATSWIIYGHTLMFFFGLVNDLRFSDERMFDITMLSVINTLQVVSLFYIITGCLLTYLAFSRQTSKQLLQPSFWVLVIIGRYIRLIPTYLLVFWFARHVAPYTGSGAYWYDYRTDSEHMRGFCATESWSTMLTMSAADVKIPFDCIPQAWYLSNDFRTLLILPFYVIILAKNVTAGYVAIFSTFVFATYKLVNILRAANIDYMLILHWQPHAYSIMADRLHDVYTDLSVRLATYLLGVLVGHLLYLYEIRTIKRWPKWLKTFGIKVALSVGVMSFLGAFLMASPIVNQFLPAREDVNSDTVVILIPIFKTAMEVSICVVLLLLASGGGYIWLNDTMTSKVAKILSNISYGVFLVHVEVMYKFPAYKFESSYWYFFSHATFFVVLSNVVAFFIYLFYEMPINNMLRGIFRKVLKTVVK